MQTAQSVDGSCAGSFVFFWADVSAGVLKYSWYNVGSYWRIELIYSSLGWTALTNWDRDVQSFNLNLSDQLRQIPRQREQSE